MTGYFLGIGGFFLVASTFVFGSMWYVFKDEIRSGANAIRAGAAPSAYQNVDAVIRSSENLSYDRSNNYYFADYAAGIYLAKTIRVTSAANEKRVSPDVTDIINQYTNSSHAKRINTKLKHTEQLEYIQLFS